MEPDLSTHGITPGLIAMHGLRQWHGVCLSHMPAFRFLRQRGISFHCWTAKFA
jgi:hypothetical protein